MGANDKKKTNDDDKDEDGTLTQADVDRIVADRLKRERAKFADYDELKAKAEAADKAKESDKGEADKLTEQLTKMQADLDEERRQRRIIEVTQEKGLTPAHVKRLTGSTKEELEASADELLEDFPIPAKSDGGDDDGKGDSDDKGTGKGGEAKSSRPKEALKSGAAPSDTAPADVTPGMGRLRAAYANSETQ